MARPDPALLVAARYPFHCTIETRFSDLDVNQHINNVSLIGLLEEGRVRFHRESGYHQASQAWSMTTMVASLAVEFIGQSHFPEPLEMHVGAVRIGRTSYELCQLVSQKNEAVAFARSVLVCMRDNQPFAIPPDYRESVEPWMMQP
jgi:acyl-CoA thioester hydrolase